MASPFCAYCSCPLDPNRSGACDYCCVCETMRAVVAENRYLRQVQERDEQERCAARRRMGLAGE